MKSNRRFLLAAVSVSLSTPALAREAEKPPRIEPAAADAVATTEVLGDENRTVTADELSFDAYELGFLDLSMCELTTANTKGPSYDEKCLARLKR